MTPQSQYWEEVLTREFLAQVRQFTRRRDRKREERCRAQVRAQANAMPTTSAPPVILTEGQWSALIFQCPEDVKPLLLRLAVHHGAIERPTPETCPLCGKRDADKQEKLFG
jgi:hypothetical protein